MELKRTLLLVGALLLGAMLKDMVLPRECLEDLIARAVETAGQWGRRSFWLD